MRVALALVATAVLALPAIGAGYFLDDYLYLDRLAADPGDAADLYRLTAAHGGPAASIMHGDMPWWLDSQAKVELCRPLASLLFTADRALFGDAVWAAHVHSILWGLALTWIVARLYRRLAAPVAVVALAIFVVDDAHWQPLGWLANRHAVVAAAPALLGLLAYVAHREGKLRRGMPLALVGFAVGLAGGETAVQVLAYVLAYVLWGPGRTLRPAWRPALRALAPVLVLVGVYLVLYRGLGFGARGHQQYLDPIGEAVRFLAAAIVRAPTLLADAIAGMPADLWAVLPVLHPIYVGVGLVATALAIAMVRTVWPRLDPMQAVELRWLALGSLGSLLPALAGLPGSRLLLVPGIGGAVVIATLIVHLRSRLARGWLVVVHLVLAPILLVAGFVNMRVVGRAAERVVIDAEITTEERNEETDVVVLYAPDIVALLYPPHMLGTIAPRQRGWFTLSIAASAHLVERTGARSLRVRALDGPLFASEWERLFRAQEAALEVGARVVLDGLAIEIVATDTIDITTERDLDDPRLVLLAWRDGALRRVVLAPGASLRLDRAPGVLGPL